MPTVGGSPHAPALQSLPTSHEVQTWPPLPQLLSLVAMMHTESRAVPEQHPAQFEGPQPPEPPPAPVQAKSTQVAAAAAQLAQATPGRPQVRLSAFSGAAMHVPSLLQHPEQVLALQAGSTLGRPQLPASAAASPNSPLNANARNSMDS
jgi:hypothetical protein